MNAKVMLAVALAASAAGARTQGPVNDRRHAYSFFHFKEQLPLELDKTRIAVLRVPGKDGAAAEPARRTLAGPTSSWSTSWAFRSPSTAIGSA